MGTARPVVLAPVQGDYVKFVGPVHTSLVAARLTGLSHLVLETADPMRVEIKHQRSPMTLLYTNGARSADAFIQALPANVDLRYSIAEQRVEYHGSDVINMIEGHASDPGGLSTPRVKFAHLVVKGLPTSVSLRYEPLAGGNGRITYDGPKAASAVEVGFATNTDVDLTGPPGDFVRVRGTVDNGMAATRITGLSHAVLETGDPIRLEVRHSRVPITIDQANGGQALHAYVDPLPANVDLRYSPSAQRVEYHGSDPVASISADASNPAGLVNGKVKEAHLALSGLPSDVILEHPPSQQRISYRGSAGIGEIRTDVRDSNGLVGRAKKVTSLVHGLPSAVDVSYATSGAGAAMIVEAKDPAGALVSIGLAEVLLTSGPEEPLPTAVDGVRIVNRPDRWMVFGRATGVKRATADRVRTCQSSPFAIGFLFWQCRARANLTLDTTASRVVEVDIRNQAAPGVPEQYVSATLDRLVANVSLPLVDESGLSPWSASLRPKTRQR